jgi:AcrR family transcriptional regulator
MSDDVVGAVPAAGSAHTRGRPRSVGTDQRISRAVLDVLQTHGPGAVTVEAVSAASGVAKTTIYRRFSDREDMLRSTLTDLIKDPGGAPDGPTREKIRWALSSIWHQMADVLGPGGLAAMVATDDPYAELIRAVVAPYSDALSELIRADVEAGALRADLDADACVSLLVGAYLGEVVRRGIVDEEFAESCLDLMWIAMRPTS